MIDETAIRGRFEALRPRLEERGRRLFCAAEARTAGYGGVGVVARATGGARSTINRRPEGLAGARSRALEDSALPPRTPGADPDPSPAVGRFASPAGVDD